MPSIARIVAVEFRHCPENGEDRVTVIWRDRHGVYGRTEGLLASPHIHALVVRATYEGAEFSGARPATGPSTP